jgi:hypothetical protein
VQQELQARVDRANGAGADLFVSVHSNAHSDRDVAGAITFYGPELGYAYELKREPRLVARSRQLATALQHELVTATAETDRGVRQAPFWVLGRTRMPSALVEAGFLTNFSNAGRLADPAYRKRIAQGIFTGIVRYLATEEDALFVADVTYPDGSVVAPGERFEKTWRLRNVGATTWGPGYRLAFHGGERLGAPAAVPLSGSQVLPGAEVDVSVPLHAPSGYATRVVEGRWQLQTPGGTWFGDRVWVAVLPRGALRTDRAAPLDHPEFTYFERTGHNVGFGFRRAFERLGGLDLFGFPRTEEFEEDGRTVQYFQRARFEYHPEHAGTAYEVQLTLLGDLLTAGRRPFTGVAPFDPDPNHQYFAETGHAVHFAFLRYFRERGGLDVFGYPISEELWEGGFTVQHFQRARFEYHPEHAGTAYEVQLGLLGDHWLKQRGWLP